MKTQMLSRDANRRPIGGLTGNAIIQSSLTRQIDAMEEKQGCAADRLVPHGSKNRSRRSAHMGSNVPRMHELRVAIVDSEQHIYEEFQNAINQQGLAWKLERYLYADRVVQELLASPPDVLLMDVVIFHAPGSDCVRKLRTLIPGLPILIFTAPSATQTIIAGIMAGACGYLVKPIAAESLIDAVWRVAKGLPALGLEAQKAVVESLHAIHGRPRSSLTSRELQIMALLFREMEDKQIAQAMGISPGTVHVHLANLFKKLAAHNRVQAVVNFLNV